MHEQSSHAGPGFAIRPLRASDASDLAGFYPRGVFAGDLNLNIAEDLAAVEAGIGATLVAEAGGRVVATARVELVGSSAWLQNVVTHPWFRGRGIATGLVRGLVLFAARQGAGRFCAHVRSTNLPARRAYEKAGLRCVGADGMGGEQLRYEAALEGVPPA
jgi:RimJ/RimL family protein N-acetyltransferase